MLMLMIKICFVGQQKYNNCVIDHQDIMFFEIFSNKTIRLCKTLHSKII